MSLKNSSQSFGSIAKIFHWTIFTLFLIQYSTAMYTIYILPDKDPLGGVLIGSAHKPFGVIALLIVFLAFLWHLGNTPVKFPNSMPVWERRFALLVHRSLYVYLILMGSTGVLLNVFGGRGVNFWNLFEIPSLMEKKGDLANFFFESHETLAFIGLGLIALHLGGILKQHLIRKDPVLQKMLPKFFERYFDKR